MKEKYIPAEMEIIEFEAEDVIRTSRNELPAVSSLKLLVWEGVPTVDGNVSYTKEATYTDFVRALR